MANVAQKEIKFTNREKDCLRILAYGMTAKEIAREMDISPRTVEGYLQALRIKMGCSCKSQLVIKILKQYAQVNLLI